MSYQLSPTILDALGSRVLFGGMGFDEPSWRPWRVFLAALFGLPMDDADLAIFQHHTGRTAAPSKPCRAAELVCGRRGGKSRTLGLIAAYLAVVPDHRRFIAPGETPVIAVLAVNRDQASVIFNYIVGFLRHSPAVAAMITDVLAESIRLSNGVTIEVHTASVAAPRGRTFLAVLCDEIAFWPTGDSANPDNEVITAVRPGLTTIPYSLLLIASSPYAKRGVLYTNYAKWFGRDDASMLVWQGTTQEMCSKLEGDESIAEMYADDPDRAVAEYGAQFRSDIVAFITREAVEDVVAGGIRELPPVTGLQYSAFVDPSGGSADSMTLAISHLDSDGVAVLDAVRERRPPFSPDDVTQEFSELLRTYRVARVTGDAYAGEWPRERFGVHGISYEVSGRNKSKVYQDFLPALNGRRLRLLDIPRLVSQLCNLERRVARGGRDSIDHTPGAHDDLANAAAGALTLVINDRRPALIRPDALLVDDVPVVPVFVRSVFATIWIGVDGMCAYALFAHQPHNTPKLCLMDFDVRPWSAVVPEVIAQRLDELAEEAAARNVRSREAGVSAVIYSQAQAVPACAGAMRQIFTPRLSGPCAWRRAIAAHEIDAAYLRDPVALLMDASAQVAAGDVKLSGAAAERACGVPLLGALAVQAGQDVAADPLRVALLLGVALGLGAEPSHKPMAVPGARVAFG